MNRAFQNGLGDPNLCTLLVGARGSGKTALLTQIALEAESCGWISARSSALPGLLDDVYQCALRGGKHLLRTAERKVVGLEVGQLFGVEWESAQSTDENWRSKMTRVLDGLEEADCGLLITVDEVNPALDEVKTLVSVYQHFVTEGRKVALCMAGLPAKISALLSDEDVSFLRRARKQTLGRLDNVDVELAFKKTFELAGGKIAEDALTPAAIAIDGFPYMLQLVGYWTWECAGDVEATTQADVAKGVAYASRDLREGVLEVTWNELSTVDKKFVAAMLECDGDTTLAQVAEAMGVKSNYASRYKKRLLEQGLIGEYGGNVLRLEIPCSREYFAERLASE